MNCTARERFNPSLLTVTINAKIEEDFKKMLGKSLSVGEVQFTAIVALGLKQSPNPFPRILLHFHWYLKTKIDTLFTCELS